MNYRLEVNLEAWREQQKEEDSGILVPDTGVFGQDGSGVMAVAISVVVFTAIAGGTYVVIYIIRRRAGRLGFENKR